MGWKIISCYIKWRYEQGVLYSFICIINIFTNIFFSRWQYQIWINRDIDKKTKDILHIINDEPREITISEDQKVLISKKLEIFQQSNDAMVQEYEIQIIENQKNKYIFGIQQLGRFQ